MKANIASYAGVEHLLHRTQNYGKNLEIFSINTESRAHGQFLETPLNDEINLINQNVISSIHLIKRILPNMINRKSGRIIFTFSQESKPVEAVYRASKAFLTIFVESIKKEIKDSGVTIQIQDSGTARIMTKIQVYTRKWLEPGLTKH